MFFHILILIWATYFSEEVRFYGLPRETCGVGFSVLYILACDRHMWWVRKIISNASYKLLTKRVRATNSRWSTHQHWFHLKIVKILICKDERTSKLCWRGRSFGKREVMFDISSVSFKCVTLKKETCLYISLFLSNPVERWFSGFSLTKWTVHC